MPAAVEKASGQRWHQILAFLEAQGGNYQAKLDDFGYEIGIPVRSLGRHLDRMKQLGVIRVERISGFGIGREPNRYVLIVSSAEWDERGAALVVAYDERKAVERSRKPKPRARARTSAPPAPVAPLSPADELRIQAEQVEAHGVFLASELAGDFDVAAPAADEVAGWL